MEIRPEQVGDEQEIYELTLAAFEQVSFGDGTEASIINGLRRDGDLTISLVAVKGGEVVGHAAFSPVTLNGTDSGWYGLGPVSVRPGLQRAGIGKRLINQGLSLLKTHGAKGCALIGNPDYYCRFGFKSDGKLTYGDVPARNVLWLSFGDEVAAGILKFSPAFEQ